MTAWGPYRTIADLPAGFWRWEHFTPQEIACRGDGSILVDLDALEALSRLRGDAGCALIVLSAYRSPIHNARVGGAPGSQHKLGRAFDIRWPDVSRETFQEQALAAGFRGIGRYPAFVHVDLGPLRTWSNPSWNGSAA